MRRAAAVTLIATGAVLTVTLTATNEPAPSKPPTAEQVVGFINHQREARGLPRLRRSPILSAIGARWAAHLAATGSFVHATSLRTRGFVWAAEVLYRGPNGPVRPWLRSPPHRAILLSPKAQLVGIGHSGNVYVGRFGAR